MKLRLAKNWQEFTCSAIPDFEPRIKLSNVRLYYESTSRQPYEKLPAHYDVKLQFLTNTNRVVDCNMS